MERKRGKERRVEDRQNGDGSMSFSAEYETAKRKLVFSSQKEF